MIMETKKIEKAIELNLDIQEVGINDLNGINFVSSVEKQPEAKASESVALTDDNIDLLVGRIASAMNRVAKQEFKGSFFLEPDEVESLKKDVFINETISSEKRAELEHELTKFQQEITTNYKEAISDYKEKRMYCETQMYMFEQAKKESVMKRAAQMLWPFDEKTRSYDAQIASLKIQAARYSQKIEDIESMRPAAKEKDIMLFQVKLKEKFSA